MREHVIICPRSIACSYVMPRVVSAGDEESTMQLLSGLAELLNNIPATEVDSQYRWGNSYETICPTSALNRLQKG